MKEKKRRSIFGRLQRTPKWKKEEFTELSGKRKNLLNLNMNLPL